MQKNRESSRGEEASGVISHYDNRRPNKALQHNRDDVLRY
jgi:hypothetical protein